MSNIHRNLSKIFIGNLTIGQRGRPSDRQTVIAGYDGRGFAARRE
jgi:hypothetical protein